MISDDSEASDVGSPRFEGDTGAEAPAAASSGVGIAPIEDVEVEELEEEDLDVHFKRKRQGGSRRKRVVKKSRRYAPNVITEGESSAVPPPPALLVIKRRLLGRPLSKLFRTRVRSAPFLQYTLIYSIQLIIYFMTQELRR